MLVKKKDVETCQPGWPWHGPRTVFRMGVHARMQVVPPMQHEVQPSMAAANMPPCILGFWEKGGMEEDLTMLDSQFWPSAHLRDGSIDQGSRDMSASGCYFVSSFVFLSFSAQDIFLSLSPFNCVNRSRYFALVMLLAICSSRSIRC